MSEIIGLRLASALSVHGATIEVETSLILLPFGHRTILLKQGILLLQEVSVEVTLCGGDYIFGKEDCGLIVLLTAEDVDNTFLRKSAIVGRKCLLRRLTLNVISLTIEVYTEVRRVLNTIGLVFIG